MEKNLEIICLEFEIEIKYHDWDLDCETAKSLSVSAASP